MPFSFVVIFCALASIFSLIRFAGPNMLLTAVVVLKMTVEPIF